jgi:predicted cation transporter
MYGGLETASVIASIAAFTGWGLSFAGVNKYLRSHSTHKDNGFYMLFSIFVSLAVAIAAAAGSKMLLTQTAPSGMGLVTGSNIALAVAVAAVWGISFLGLTRHLRSHSTKKDNGFIILLATAASLVVAIVAAAAASRLLTMQPALSGMDGLTTANITLAVAVVAIWAISFVGLSRHLKSHSTKKDNGFIILLSTAASLVVAIVAAAAASRISMLASLPADLGYGVTPVDIGLGLVALAVLVGPFTVKKIEHNLEAFLFVMGVLSVTIAGVWEMNLLEEAIMEPVVKGIVPAVLVAGTAFHYGRSRAQSAMSYILDHVSLKAVTFVMIVGLGLMSSVITAIIAALLLVELVNCMPLERKDKINLVIIACFAIGLGAVLTPLGEPLSTIAISKLQGPPYNAGFFFLFEKLALYVIPGVLVLGVLGALLTGKAAKQECIAAVEDSETLRDVGMRAAKVYIFVMALLLLGAGMKIIIDKYFIAIPSEVLYWVNMLSAILDNATLTAAEIAPSLTIGQITAALMGLLIAGGMLVPGNIPNIISANKLGITSKEWARLGVPLGLVLLVIYYAWIFYIPFGPLAG